MMMIPVAYLAMFRDSASRQMSGNITLLLLCMNLLPTTGETSSLPHILAFGYMDALCQRSYDERASSSPIHYGNF